MNARAVALLAIAAVSCGAPRETRGIPEGAGPLIATYRAEFTEAGASPRRARVVLWAAMPDRLHAELIGPVGGVRWILDAGGGTAAVVDVAESVAYVGPAGPEAVSSLTGVAIGVDEVVAALLSGAAPEGTTVEREGESPGLLPSRFRLARGDAAVALTRTRWERSPSEESALGTGTPPAGLAVRPIEALPEAR